MVVIPQCIYILLTVCTHVEQINSVSFFTYCVYTRHSCSNNVSGTVVQASRHPALFLEDLSGVVPCFSLYWITQNSAFHFLASSHRTILYRLLPKCRCGIRSIVPLTTQISIVVSSLVIQTTTGRIIILTIVFWRWHHHCGRWWWCSW